MGGQVMKKATLALLFVVSASAAWASNHRFHSGSHHADWAAPSNVTCETVRTYVSQLGFAQARAIALANGMTAAQERRASRQIEMYARGSPHATEIFRNALLE